MLTKKEAITKITQGEGLYVEFKTSFNDEVIETLVAFSNAKGGTVYIGVSNKRKFVGITVGKETVQQWINEIKNKTSPQIIPDAEVLTIDGKTVVSLYIIEYPIKPVSVRGRFYKRVGNSNHLLSLDEIANEHLKTINSSWDYYTDPNHFKTDLSEEKIAKFVNRIRQNNGIQQVGLSDWEILNKMEILRNDKVTFGAYLLFVKDYCVISDVQIGRFKSDITIIDSTSLNSDLFQEVDDIMAFIKKHLKIEYIITSEPQRTERFDYPLDAIREIVINMVVHRDYRDSSASIIKIFDDRIEFYNPGKLYDGITVQDLLSGNYTSKSRNKLIAKVFKEVGMIERYGSGIMRVRKICKDYGVKEPDFIEMHNGFQVVLYNEKIVTTEDVTVNDENVTVNNEKVIVNDGKVVVNDKKVIVNDGKVVVNDKKVVVNDGKVIVNKEKVIVKMTQNQQLILNCITENPYITIENLSLIIGISNRKTATNIQKLKAKGLIERVGSDKKGMWVVKK